MNKEDKILQKKYKSAVRTPRKSISFSLSNYKSIESEDERPVIRAKFAGFGNIDDGRDRLFKGCMTKSIRDAGPESNSNRKIAFLWQHDMKDPIGLTTNIEQLDDGAYGTAKMSNFRSVPNSMRAFDQMEEGVLNQFSIGYNYVWDKMDYIEDEDVFNVYEIKLHEWSVVTAGMNEETEYEGIFESSEDLKNYLKAMQELNPQRYEQLKEFIMQQEKSRAEESLTLKWVAGAIQEKTFVNN